MGRSKSSTRWLQRQARDPFVRRAQREGQRSRAVFKLEALDRRADLFRPGMTVVDLGAAPGGWSAYAAPRVQPGGRLIALDLLPMEALPNVTFLQGDFREPEALQALERALDGRPVDLVLSDMAPNISGVSSVDQPRAMHLAELALAFAGERLSPDGALLVKLLQGEGFDAFLREFRARFRKLSLRKPPASRARSREIYALGRGLKAD